VDGITVQCSGVEDHALPHRGRVNKNDLATEVKWPPMNYKDLEGNIRPMP